MCFQVKSTLKNNYYHNIKRVFRTRESIFLHMNMTTRPDQENLKRYIENLIITMLRKRSNKIGRKSSLET
jgi:hypothetical protein